MIKKFLALSFCDVNDIIDRYHVLANKLLENFSNNQTHEGFLEYFENNWIDRLRQTARFDINT